MTRIRLTAGMIRMVLNEPRGLAASATRVLTPLSPPCPDISRQVQLGNPPTTRVAQIIHARPNAGRIHPSRGANLTTASCPAAKAAYMTAFMTPISITSLIHAFAPNHGEVPGNMDGGQIANMNAPVSRPNRPHPPAVPRTTTGNKNPASAAIDTTTSGNLTLITTVASPGFTPSRPTLVD